MKSIDPHRAREAQKYEHPIPSREFILETLSQQKQPLDFTEACEIFELEGDEECRAFKHRLRAMERDGQLIFNHNKQYLPRPKTDLILGQVIAHPDGFGFFRPDDGSEDYFLHNKQMDRVFHGDRVLVCLKHIDRRGKKEGFIAKILERNTHRVVGQFQYDQANGIGFLIPDNKRITHKIVIQDASAHQAQQEKIVVVEITQQPEQRTSPIGKIIEILGSHMDPGLEIEVALRSHDIPYEWPDAVSQQTFETNISESVIQSRLDLRSLPLVTIDGEDAKDFDDAVYCEKNGDHWRLIVAIADVSYYVRPDDDLDIEAQKRGTSVYFPGKVVPMLPEVLSNGLCSLNPQVDRLCMACEIHLNASGEVTSYAFHEAVMHSAARLTYTQVADLLSNAKPKFYEQFTHVLGDLGHLHELYQLLRHQREQRGAIDFETKESVIVFSNDQKIERIEASSRNDAHKMIEEFMILANVCAAQYLCDHEMPCLHRVHEKPDLDKVSDLQQFLNGLGLTLNGGDSPSPADFNAIMQSAKQRPDEHLIQTVLLRSMSAAHYSPNPQGHFGLAHQHYTHFTSPIRRYPDLLVHRSIKHILNAKKNPNAGSLERMALLGQHCSMTERRAEEASRDVEAWLKCEFMTEHVGDSFDGIISSVMGFGLFVELQGVFVEGLLHISALESDYYRFDPIRHRLTGEHSGKVYRIGDPVHVTVSRVDLEERKIDFVLSAPTQTRRTRSKKKKHKKS